MGAAPPGAAFTRADRNGPGAYREVARKEWDVVIDVSRQPGHVRRATTALADRAGSFVFVSATNHSPAGRNARSTLAWELGRNLQRPRRAGLSSHEERRLLHALAAA